MKLKPLILVPAAVAALALASCSSDDSNTDETAQTADGSVTVDVTETAPAAAGTCPTAAAPVTAQADWSFQGATGSIEVVAPTEKTAPTIRVQAPFTVNETEVKTLAAGSGPEVTENSTVDVCYLGVNGRDGATFDSAYEVGESAQFPAMGVVPGFRQALVGQKVGSTVAVAVTSADGYPQGQGAILPGDTIVFALKINAAQ